MQLDNYNYNFLEMYWKKESKRKAMKIPILFTILLVMMLSERFIEFDDVFLCNFLVSFLMLFLPFLILLWFSAYTKYYKQFKSNYEEENDENYYSLERYWDKESKQKTNKFSRLFIFFLVMLEIYIIASSKNLLNLLSFSCIPILLFIIYYYIFNKDVYEHYYLEFKLNHEKQNTK